MHDIGSFIAQSKLTLSLSWPGPLNLAKLNPIPPKLRPGGAKARMRHRPRLEAPSANDKITRLNTSFNVLDSARALRRRRWRLTDLQFVVLLGYMVFSTAILPWPLMTKAAVMAALALVLFVPVISQFLLPSLPIWTYLFYFFSSRFIHTEYRTHIWVKVLPALENILYGANLSNMLSAHTHPILDVLAWIPYGIGHFALPAVCSVVIFLLAAPGTVAVFARTFGYQSMLGVTIQLLFPCTPPWYEKMYGLAPAHYGMAGSPAGLARVDKLLGLDMYTTSFSTAPVPFGAFPSLHAADAILEALFMQYCFPRLRPYCVAYVAWILWATMYLNHHYAIDLVAGGIMAATAYYVARTRYLPRPQRDKAHRWAYDYVEKGDRPKLADEELGYGRANAVFDLGLLERRGTVDSDEWTIGSGSSFESMSRGDSSSSSASTPGSLSPSTPQDDFRRTMVVGMGPQGDVWDDEGSRESEHHEVMG